MNTREFGAQYFLRVPSIVSKYDEIEPSKHHVNSRKNTPSSAQADPTSLSLRNVL